MLPIPSDVALTEFVNQLASCHSKSRRNGKVARLPAEVRDQVNHMLDDGLPYKLIIQKLGPAGSHLNEDNLSNWRLGGYKDHLNAQAINERARSQTEGALDLVRQNEIGSLEQLRHVCSQISLLQYLETIAEHGERYARASLERNPGKFITLINALCNLSNTSIALDQHKRSSEALKCSMPTIRKKMLDSACSKRYAPDNVARP